MPAQGRLGDKAQVPSKQPASDGTTGTHHIFTVTEVPTHGTDGPCLEISNNSRVVENTTKKLVVKVAPTYLIREPGPKYPGPNDTWP